MRGARRPHTDSRRRAGPRQILCRPPAPFILNSFLLCIKKQNAKTIKIRPTPAPSWISIQIGKSNMEKICRPRPRQLRIGERSALQRPRLPGLGPRRRRWPRWPRRQRLGSCCSPGPRLLSGSCCSCGPSSSSSSGPVCCRAFARKVGGGWLGLREERRGASVKMWGMIFGLRQFPAPARLRLRPLQAKLHRPRQVLEAAAPAPSCCPRRRPCLRRKGGGGEKDGG